MLFIVCVLMALIIGALIYLGTLSGHYQVRRTQLINTDINSAFDKISDFKSWSDWSPWLIHEPETSLIFSDDYDQEGGYYQWDGQRVGAGRLTHTKFDRPRRIEQRIKFTRPFKSVCQVAFEFAEKEGMTEVSWLMSGKMPFLLRFKTENTKQMISKDYDLGLAMLAHQLDPEAEYPQLHFVGVETLQPQQALCLEFNGGINDMQKAMQDGFPKLMAHLEKQQKSAAGFPFTSYQKANLKTMHFICDLAVPVSESIDVGEYQLKTLGGGRFYKVTLKGGYGFLELAWHAAYAHVNMLDIKTDRSRASLEVYNNDPNQQVNSNAIETSLYVAIK